MIPLPALLQDYKDAAAFNALLAVTSFVTDRMFLTKAGELGVMYRLRGVDPDGLDDDGRLRVTRRFHEALRTFDPAWSITQYALKTACAPLVPPPCPSPVASQMIARRIDLLNQGQTFYRCDLYLVAICDALASTHAQVQATWAHPWAALTSRLSTGAALTVLEQELDRWIAYVDLGVLPFERTLADTVAPERLDARAMFRVLRRLVNYDPAKHDVSLVPAEHVDYFACGSHLDAYRDHLRLDDEYVQVCTMQAALSTTHAHVLAALQALPGEFVACLTWRRLSLEGLRNHIKGRQSHFDQQRATRMNDRLIDKGATGHVDKLGDALGQIEHEQSIFGAASFTLALHAPDLTTLHRLTTDASKIWSTRDGLLVAERYNQMNAFTAMLPGGWRFDHRQLAISDDNLADLSFLFALDDGTAHAAHVDRPLLIFETETHTPYHWYLHTEGVGHALILGAPGVGKSYITNAILAHAQQFTAATYVLDIGRSYRKLSAALDGGYLELHPSQQPTQLNPFAAPPLEEQFHFLQAFLLVLMEGTAGSAPLTQADRTAVHAAVRAVYQVARAHRCLTMLRTLLPARLKARLDPWVVGGRYGEVFDHVEDTLDLKTFQVFEFEPLKTFPELLDPVLFYVLRRIDRTVQARQGLTLCVIDEAWQLIRHPAVRDFVLQCLKGWRKMDAALIMATHTLEDFASPDLLRTVVENCPTRILLPNRDFNRDHYRALFNLNDQQIALLDTAQPRRQAVIQRPDVTKLVTLRVDPLSHWLFVNSPIENARVTQAITDDGFAAGLQRLAEGEM